MQEDATVSVQVAASAIERVHGALLNSIGKPMSTLNLPAGSEPVTGQALTDMMHRVMASLESEFKYKPVPEPFDPRIESYFASDEAKQKFARLSEWGMVAPVGPTAIKQQSPMTMVEVGDAIGLLYVTISEYLSMPDPRYTLFLMGPDDLNEYYGFPPEDSVMD